MPSWTYTVDLSHIFNTEWPANRDAIVDKIRLSGWYADHKDTAHIDGGYPLGYLVTLLSEQDDADDFDIVWDAIYDIADNTRCWIATF